MTLVPIKKKDLESLEQGWKNIPSNDVIYLDNNADNRFIFHQMGFKDEDLQRYQSLLFMIPLTYDQLVIIEYDKKGKPAKIKGNKYIIVPIGLDYSCPFGLAGDAPSHFLPLLLSGNCNPWLCNVIYDCPQGIAANAQDTATKKQHSNIPCNCLEKECSCIDKCKRNQFLHRYCLLCYGNYQKEYKLLGKYVGSFDAGKRVITLNLLKRIFEQLNFHIYYKDIEEFNSSNPRHLKAFCDDMNKKIISQREQEVIIAQAKAKYRNFLESLVLDPDDFYSLYESYKAKLDKFEEKEKYTKLKEEGEKKLSSETKQLEQEEKELAEKQKLLNSRKEQLEKSHKEFAEQMSELEKSLAK